MVNRRSAALGFGFCFALLCGHVHAAQVLVDTLQGSTIGNRSGGSFVAGGWKVVGATDEVYIDFGSPDVAFGMTNPQNSDGSTSATAIGGRNCRQNTNPNIHHHFYFGVADSFASAGSEPDQYVIADYFDTGTCNLTLQYDGASNAHQNAASVPLTHTNTWKQKVWHLTNAYFGNRQNGGADFRIGNGGITTILEGRK